MNRCLFLLLIILAATPTMAQPKFTVVKENLGPLVNDQQDQILPVFSPERKTLYFSQNTGMNEVYEVWKTQLDASGSWTAKQKVSYLNGPAGLNSYVFGAYPSNTFIINGRFDNKNDSTNFARGFSWYNLRGNQFSVKQTQTFIVEGLEEMLQGQFANAFYHPGKKVLLLSFAYMGKRDLFVSTPRPNQKEPLLQWNRPVRLPNTINTAYEESCPFLDESGTVLYFSSNRPGGFGGDDIYCSKLLSNDFLQWSPAQNLGFYVNSNKSELYYTVSSADSYAYFVSYKNSYGAGDIFRIKFEMENKWPTSNATPSNSTTASTPVQNAPATPTNIQSVPASPRPTSSTTPSTSGTTPPIGRNQLPLEEYKPNNVLFLLDVSQSMSQGAKMKFLQRACEQLLTRLRYVDKVALVTFGERSNLQYATSSLINKDSVLQIMQRLRPNEGETFINPGLQTSYRHAIDNYIEDGNNEIMVITDGYFSISQQSVELINRNPQIRLTFVLVDAGTITQNIKDYIQRRFPDARIVEMNNENLDVNKLLENVKMNSKKN